MNDNQDTKHAARRSAPLGSGADLITDERLRQIYEEGWTAENDAGYVNLELVKAAKCYLEPHDSRFLSEVKNSRGEKVPFGWPWHPHWWKPSPDTRLRELMKAGALIAAEIDRIRARFDAEMADKHAAWEAQAEGS